jgi:hypothetical protein
MSKLEENAQWLKENEARIKKGRELRSLIALADRADEVERQQKHLVKSSETKAKFAS